MNMSANQNSDSEGGLRPHHKFGNGTGLAVKLDGERMDYRDGYDRPAISVDAPYEGGTLVVTVSWGSGEWEVEAEHITDEQEPNPLIDCVKDVESEDGDTALYLADDERYDFEIEVIRTGGAADEDYSCYVPEHLADAVKPVQEAQGYLHIGIDSEYHPHGGYWVPVDKEHSEIVIPPNGEQLKFPADNHLDPLVRGEDDLPEEVTPNV